MTTALKLHEEITEEIEEERKVYAPAPQMIEVEASEGASVATRCCKDIEPEAINWLWRDRFALGKVALIAGEPGLGKSQLCLAIAAVVSSGGFWCDGGEKVEPGHVLILSSEDGDADTIVPRLIAAGATLDHCHIIDGLRDDSGRLRTFSFVEHLDYLSQKVEALGDVRLLIVDPVTAYQSGVDTHCTSDLRSAMLPLQEFAARHKIAVVCISHLNKSQHTNAAARIVGSGAYLAVVRTAFLVGVDPETEDRRALLSLKSNIGIKPDGLGFHVKGVTIEHGDLAIETCRIEFDGEPVSFEADEALAARQGDIEERSALQDAKEFLLECLREKVEEFGNVRFKLLSVGANEVKKQAAAAGISSATLNRAKCALGIKPIKIGLKEGWVWQLPKESVEDDQISRR